jgi:8-oxo-dGTP diphosphatase
MINNFSNAAKAFIVKDGKLLLIKRRPNDAHRPGEWDIPGGRLESGENPYLGLQRETREEVALEIEIKAPLDVHYFTRDDGQQITLIIFLCQSINGDIKLSEEHTEYKWVDLKNPKADFPNWLHKIIDKYISNSRE